MTYKGYMLTPTTRRMPPGQAVECVEIEGPERHTWADSMTTAKRAVDEWDKRRREKEKAAVKG